MSIAAPVRNSDFSRPIEADFIVALKAKTGEFTLFVEAFSRRNGKAYLRFTSSLFEAARFSKFKAFDVQKEVEQYRCTGRVERISPDNTDRQVVEELN